MVQATSIWKSLYNPCQMWDIKWGVNKIVLRLKVKEGFNDKNCVKVLHWE